MACFCSVEFACLISMMWWCDNEGVVPVHLIDLYIECYVACLYQLVIDNPSVFDLMQIFFSTLQ
ncbi:unnamed protein product [Albugo candida]|uniref:Uncharacterized protein n=1 Tax=Albugo candida TaxID=65357 RepID=A0A024GT81_9STRA|nr:unnamed protein product [Albugo candida]|eukprot:CCI49561.1 unnamed protein product [Albugo candida]